MILVSRDDRIVDERRELIELARPAQDVDVRELVEDRNAVALGHAADDADNQIRIRLLARAKLAQTRPDLLFSVLAYRAGVVDDDIGGITIVRRFVALAA